MKNQLLFLGLVLFLATACNKPAEFDGVQRYTDGKLDATLWTQTSPEFMVACTQTYRAGASHLQAALADPTWTASTEQHEMGGFDNLPPAVIFDLDETLLDNSPFQARMVKEQKDFNSDWWGEWVREEKAAALPGAKAWLDTLKANGVKIFYITNRKIEESTLANVKKVLDATADTSNLMCKGERNWGSDKTSRREIIAKNHRIIMLFGDDYNDFTWLGKGVSTKDRVAKAEGHKDHWGKKWFLLSNPSYGTWERSMYNYESGMDAGEKWEVKRKFLRSMDDPE